MGNPKAELVNDVRCGRFPVAHLRSYSQETDTEISQSKTLFARKRQRAFLLAEQVGFEPTGLERLTDFESASL